MEGNELSYSEYLKCNNACVKVTINRYRGLCPGTLRELRDNIPWSSLIRFVDRLFIDPHVEQSFVASTFMIIGVCVYFIHTLNQNVLDKAEKCKATDLSSLIVVLRRIVDITKGIDQHFPSLARVQVAVYMARLLRKLVEQYDPRHPSLRFCLLLMLHNFILPEVIKAGNLLTKQPHLRRMSTFNEQDFEPEEIYHGTGFAIADNFVITSKHVIEEAMSDETLQICILNETIGELPCVVVHCDAANDLALLYCHDLNLKQHKICPLDLSEEALWPSLSVFSFGYPFTHTGRSALFVKGYVSGLKKRYGDNRKPFWVLNCDLNAGNSGGPVLRRIGDDIKVVGVVAQKHKKEILTLEELSILEEERSTLQMNSASDSSDQFWKSVSLKMYDALNETHCQFGYGNVVPGHLVVEFLSDPSVTSIMDFLKEAQYIETEFDVQG